MNKKMLLSLSLASFMLFTVGCSNNETSNNKEEETQNEQIGQEIEKTEESSENKETEKTAEEIALEEEKKVEEEIIAVIHENVRASEAEDIEAYNKTLAARYSDSEENIQSLTNLFTNFDIDYDIKSIEILEVKEDTAVVEVVQTQIATYTDPNWQFNDSEAIVIHTFIKEEDGWKFYTTEVLETKDL